MSTRNVMPPDQEQAIQNLAQFGRYQNASDVMRAGLRLLRSLPGQLRLDFSDGIQDPQRPALILWLHDNNTKAVIMPFKPHALGIIDMQVDIKCWRKFRGRVQQSMRGQGAAVQRAVDHAVDADAVQQQPAPDVGRRPAGRGVYPDTAALAP